MKTTLLLLQALRLLRREMRHGIRGFGVFLVCLFLGVFTISAIGNFSAAARQGLLDDAGALLGGDLEIRLINRPMATDQLDFLRQQGTVSQILQLRTMARTDSNANRGLVELKAVDQAYPLYGSLPLAPAQPLAQALTTAKTPGAVVEKAFLQRFSVAVGDRVRLGDATFTIRAVIENEPDRSIRAFNLGPRIMVARAAMPATGLIQPGSLVNYLYRLKLPDRNQAEAVKQLLTERFPEAGWRIRTWREAAPRVRSFLDRMETNLTLLGLCSLLVGGLGVTGAVRGYLTAKIHHIATLKCLGASRAIIFTTYLLQILLLGAIGSTAGLLAGAALPWLIVQLFGGSFPIPMEPGLFPRVWLLAMSYGLLIALLFSLQELGKACRVTPAALFRSYTDMDSGRPGPGSRAAVLLATALLVAIALVSSPDQRLALWFIVGAAGCFVLFKLLATATIRLTGKLPRASNPSVRLALADIARPGSPAGGILFSLGIGLTVLVMIVQVQSNLNDMVRETLPKDAPAFFFFDIQPDQIDSFKKLFAQLPPGNSLKASPALRGRITAIKGVPVDKAHISPEVRWAVRGDRFLSYAAQLPPHTVLSSGAWWPENYSGPPLISLTRDLANGFSVGLGDTLEVNILGRTITAKIANVRTVDWTSLELNFAIIFAPGVLESAPQTYIAAAQLEPALEQTVYRQVTDRFPNVSALSVREVLKNVSITLERIAWVFKGIAAIALLSGLLVLSGAVSADQHRRIRDAVILKVCGATRRDILTAFAAEFILLGLSAGTVSLLAGSAAAMAIVDGPLKATYRLQPGIILLTLGIGILLTLVLGLAGTWKALGQKPSSYLRNE